MEALIAQIGMPLVVSVLVPIAIAGIKKVLPKVPKNLIPVLAPISGALLDFGMASLANVPTGGATAGALAGLAGIGLRELKEKGWVAIQEMM